MSNVTTEVQSGSDTGVYGDDDLLAMAQAYRADSKIVNAASGYDSLDDAIAALTSVWEVIERTRQDGAGFTPATSLGFGSDNASQIAEKIMGLSSTVGATRKSLATLGKVS